ncbi:hypothetical protein [Nostoc sp. LPT]|uniref:hypothetical protein n=1 Tax=Nostoc sp. LPT TaxID=2815387 RepID=UPI001D288ED0|nr:hypothetical protein [Nostoc sp. LPT]MBN4002394.1 hypothetical protein [Nostoc sp. LPT]
MQEFAVATFFYSDGSSKSVSHRYSRTRSHFLSATRAIASQCAVIEAMFNIN